MSDLHCAELVELVTEYLDGVLDAETEQRVTDHLSLCDACATYVAQFRRTVDELGHLPPSAVDDLPDSARETLLAAFRRKHG